MRPGWSGRSAGLPRVAARRDSGARGVAAGHTPRDVCRRAQVGIIDSPQRPPRLVVLFCCPRGEGKACSQFKRTGTVAAPISPQRAPAGSWPTPPTSNDPRRAGLNSLSPPGGGRRLRAHQPRRTIIGWVVYLVLLGCYIAKFGIPLLEDDLLLWVTGAVFVSCLGDLGRFRGGSCATVHVVLLTPATTPAVQHPHHPHFIFHQWISAGVAQVRLQRLLPRQPPHLGWPPSQRLSHFFSWPVCCGYAMTASAASWLYVTLTPTGFATYVLYPAMPPWMASSTKARASVRAVPIVLSNMGIHWAVARVADEAVQQRRGRGPVAARRLPPADLPFFFPALAQRPGSRCCWWPTCRPWPWRWCTRAEHRRFRHHPRLDDAVVVYFELLDGRSLGGAQGGSPPGAAGPTPGRAGCRRYGRDRPGRAGEHPIVWAVASPRWMRAVGSLSRRRCGWVVKGCSLRPDRRRRSGGAGPAIRPRWADELVFLDITASSDQRDTMMSTWSRAAPPTRRSSPSPSAAASAAWTMPGPCCGRVPTRSASALERPACGSASWPRNFGAQRAWRSDARRGPPDAEAATKSGYGAPSPTAGAYRCAGGPAGPRS